MGLLSKWVKSLDYEYEILPSCTRFVSSHSHCEKCVESCNNEAISFIKEKPVIQHNKCIECGKCISACPVQAIAGIYPKRTIIQNQLVIKGQMAPTVKELLILYKNGVKKIIGETESLIELWRQPIEKANSILSQVDELPFSISIKSVEEEENFSRREFFTFWGKEAKSALKQAAPAKMRFNQDALDMQKYYKGYQFTSITIDIEKCILCEACQKLCKKKCFDFQDNYFMVSPQGCSSCQLCVDACPKQAITVKDKISKKQETKLLINKKVCTVCHKPYITLRENDEKCVACTMREMINKNRKLG